MTKRMLRASAAAVASLATLAVLAGCASNGPTADAGSPGQDAPAEVEVAAGDRLVVSIENGLVVLDAKTLSVVEQFSSEEFTRVNAVGDGRHVLVTTSKGFQVLDTAEPELTDTVFEAQAAGHVVRHGGKTVLFADGTGETTVFDTDALLETDGALPESDHHRAESAHHGVSIVLQDDTLVTTVGDETSRSGAVALEPHDDHFHEIAANDECPSIHGEGTAADEAVVFGCENGALLYQDGAFVKLDAPDEFGRMGNAYVSESSALVVGDYRDDPDAEGYLLNDVALIDTAARTLDVANLGDVRYTWRGVVRGPDDLAYILGTDGAIHVLDPADGEITDSFPVIDAWQGPAEWQNAHPALVTDGDVAYVADVANSRIVSVDLATGEVIAEGETLPAAPNEMAINLG